jgi:hypothetical protein
VVITLKFIAQKKKKIHDHNLCGFRIRTRRKKFINPQRWLKVLIWKILPEQWLGVDRGTASR